MYLEFLSETRNCRLNLISLLSEVEKDKLINYKCALLQLDLSAAYDLVSFIDIVIAMDEFLKRNDQHLKNPHLLLFSYFWATNRTIIFEGTKFTPKNGLPQGAPLSCSIFVIILSFNPKPPASALLKIHAYYFADDASFYVSGPDLEAVKATVLEIVRDFENWCTEHSMVLNYEKSKILWFMPTDPELDIAIENAPWVRVLGVYFDKKLNFEHHVGTLIEYVKKYQRPLRYLMYLGPTCATIRHGLSQQIILWSLLDFQNSGNPPRVPGKVVVQPIVSEKLHPVRHLGNWLLGRQRQ